MLSDGELAVITFIAQGLQTKEIAQRLGRATRTIQVQRYNAMRKLNVHNVAEIVHWAVSNGHIKIETQASERSF